MVKNGIAQHSEAVIEKLRGIGVEVEDKGDSVKVSAKDPLKPIDIRTAPYPGFPTDVQSPIMALMATVDGISVVTDTIFLERFMHVSELNRMGANIKVEGNVAVVKGVPKLSGAPVMASELRGGAGLVLAGLAAENQTVVSRVYHIDRGYEHIEKKLAGVGADIERVSD